MKTFFAKKNDHEVCSVIFLNITCSNFFIANSPDKRWVSLRHIYLLIFAVVSGKHTAALYTYITFVGNTFVQSYLELDVLCLFHLNSTALPRKQLF